MKLTTEDQRAANPAGFSGSPINALGVAGEGPRPSDPQRPICERCGQPVPAERVCGRPGCRSVLTAKRRDARYCSRACNQAVRRDRKATRKVHNRSGLQVSYHRMVELLAIDYALLNLPDARRQAEKLVREALPARQRARLDERGKGTE